MTRNAMKRPDIVQAIRNPKLFGSMFKSLDSWRAWIVWLKAVFGLKMDEGERELFQRCTGRNSVHTDPSLGFKESYAIVGRRGGKSRIVSFAGVFIACFYDFSKYLAPGER